MENSYEAPTDLLFIIEKSGEAQNNSTKDDEKNSFSVNSVYNGNLKDKLISLEKSSDKDFSTSLADEKIALSIEQGSLGAGKKSRHDISDMELSSESFKDSSQKNATLNLDNCGNGTVASYRPEDALNYLSNLIKTANKKKSASPNSNLTDSNTLKDKMLVSSKLVDEPKNNGISDNVRQFLSKLSGNSLNGFQQCSVSLPQLHISNSDVSSHEKSLRKETDPKLGSRESEDVDPGDSPVAQSVETISDGESALARASPYWNSGSTRAKFTESIGESKSEHHGLDGTLVAETLSAFENGSEKCSSRKDVGCLENLENLEKRDATKSFNGKVTDNSSNSREDKELSALLKCVFDDINNDSDLSSEKSFEVDFNHNHRFGATYDDETIQSKTLRNTLCDEIKDSVNGIDLDYLEECSESSSKQSRSETSKIFGAQQDTQLVPKLQTFTDQDFDCIVSQANEKDEELRILTKPCVVLLPRISVDECLLKSEKVLNLSCSQSNGISTLSSGGSKLQEWVGSVTLNDMKRKLSQPSNICVKNIKLQKKKHITFPSSKQISDSYAVKKHSSLKHDKVFKENKKPATEPGLNEQIFSTNKDSRDNQIICRYKKSEEINQRKSSFSCDEFAHEKTPEFNVNSELSDRRPQEENFQSINHCDAPFNFQFQDELRTQKNGTKDDCMEMLPLVPRAKSNESLLSGNTFQIELNGTTFAAFIEPKRAKSANTNKRTHQKQKETHMSILEDAASANNVDVVMEKHDLIHHQTVFQNVNIGCIKYDGILIKPCKVLVEKLNIDASIIFEATRARNPSFYQDSNHNFDSKSDKRKLQAQNKISKKVKFSKNPETLYTYRYDSVISSDDAGLENEDVSIIDSYECSNLISNSFDNCLLSEEENMTLVTEPEPIEYKKIEEILMENDETATSNLSCKVDVGVDYPSLKPCSVRMKKLNLNSLSLKENIKIKLSDLAQNEFCEDCLSANKACAHDDSVTSAEAKSEEMRRNERETRDDSCRHNQRNRDCSYVIEWKEADSEQWTLTFNKRNYRNRKGEKMSKFFCVQCDRNLKSAEDLFYHLCSGKKKQGFLCEYCEKIFNSCCTLTSHKISHVITLD